MSQDTGRPMPRHLSSCDRALIRGSGRAACRDRSGGMKQYGPGSDPEGVGVIRKIYKKSEDWLSRRAAVDVRSAVGASDTPDSTAGAVSGESSTGWDPWEVWLRRIEQPRRGRSGGESSRG